MERKKTNPSILVLTISNPRFVRKQPCQFVLIFTWHLLRKPSPKSEKRSASTLDRQAAIKWTLSCPYRLYGFQQSGSIWHHVSISTTGGVYLARGRTTL